jgi:GNAT superfamily N-acetyltransferase
MPLTTRPLDPSTWAAFAELVERNNGVFGGCWCMGGYPEGLSRTDAEENRANKHRRVHEGRAHAALVFDEQGCVQGWCQYGDPQELARVKHRRAYEQEPPPRPDWRIQCFFVDPRHRGQGVARAALAGAVAQIAGHGGGRVEAISEATTGRKAPGRFLFSATVELFEQYGFDRGRQLGKHAYLVTRFIEPATRG